MESTVGGLLWFVSAIYSSSLAVALLPGLSMTCYATRRESNREVKIIENMFELVIEARANS